MRAPRCATDDRPDDAQGRKRLHRRVPSPNRPVPGCISVVGVSDGERLRGVAVVGRPIARALDDGLTAEVRRCCTDGAPNACSFYRAAWGRSRRSATARSSPTRCPRRAAPHYARAGSRSSGKQAADAGTAPAAPPPTRTRPARSCAGSCSHERPPAATTTSSGAPIRLLPGRTRPMSREQEQRLVRALAELLVEWIEAHPERASRRLRTAGDLI